MTRARAPRSDRLRNRDAILDAAERVLAADPRASMLDIANAAGVGRVTIYGHFATREQLIEKALIRAIERSEAELAAVDLDGDPLDALDRLVRRSWRIVDRFHRMLAAVEATLTNDEILAHHAQPMARVQQLVERGQAVGVMRADLDAAWLTTCFTAILHAAAAELRAGKLSEDKADRVVAATVLALVHS
jgi:TetR/AcrR family transcriptional regulator, mexCD-oprJ operon repressor